MAQSTATEKTARSSKPRSRAVVKNLLEQALRRKFPHDTVDISDGFDGDIHVLTVSRIFEKMSNRGRYAYLWNIVERSGLSDAEKDLVTVVVGVSPSEFM